MTDVQFSAFTSFEDQVAFRPENSHVQLLNRNITFVTSILAGFESSVNKKGSRCSVCPNLAGRPRSGWELIKYSGNVANADPD